MPQVSIVLPTHNRAQYLSTAIESCLNQSVQDIELIVVDDGSTDATAHILAGIADPRVLVLRHATNLGVSAALNTGLARASGEYLTSTSDDNLYAPTALEEMLHCLSSSPELDFVYTDYYVIDDYGIVGRVVEVRPPESLIFQNYVGPCFLYRRAVYEAVGGFDANFALAEDYDYWLRIWKQFSMYPLDRALYYYRLHSQSLTTRYRNKVRDAVRAVQVARLAEDHSIDPSIRATILMLVGFDHCADGVYETGAEWFTHAYELDRSVLELPDRFEHILTEYVLSNFGDSLEELLRASSFIDALFVNLRAMLKPVRSTRLRVLGHLDIVRAFRAHAERDWAQVRRAAITGLLRNPKWLKNRGVWSIGLQAFTGIRRESYDRS